MKKLFPYVIAGIFGGLIVLSADALIKKNSQNDILVQEMSQVATPVNEVVPKFPFDFKKAASTATPTVVHILAEESEQMA